MARLILFAIVVVVAVLIWIVKAAAGAVTGSEKLQQETLRSQTQKTMHTAARGVNWLNEQWEQAKQATRQHSGDQPYLALLIAVPEYDHAELEQAKRFFAEYGSRINAMTRIDSSLQDGSDTRLARMCIDINGWPGSTVSAAIRELSNCVAQLEQVGRAAFAIRFENGRSELLAKNSLCS